MVDDDDDDGDGGEGEGSSPTLYRLTPGGEGCDLCAGMAGEYPAPPDVPLHPNCQCTVDEIGDEESNKTCFFEIRQLESYEEKYTEEETKYWGYNSPDEEFEIDFEVDLGIIEESFDPGVEDALSWSPDYGENSQTVTFPPGGGHGTISCQVEYTQIICKGELWRVCTTPDPIAGVHTEETYVADVGGMALARTALISCDDVDDWSTEDDDPPPPDGPRYYQDDEEVPV